MSASRLLTMTKEPGVADLPLSVRGPFAKAIIAEQDGKHEEAEKWLLTAIEAEEKNVSKDH